MPSKIFAKIDAINRKLNRVEKIEEHLERLVTREERETEKVEKEELKIEKSLVKLGNFTINRSHILELARGVAGAFLGVGLGQALGTSVNLAKTLPWLNTFGILVFILIIVSVLIYKHDKDEITQRKQNALRYIFRKFWLYT